MKKTFVLFLSLLGVLNASGQYAINQSDVKNQGYYYTKYRIQNKAGTFLAVGGTTMILVGAVGVISNFDLGYGNSVENQRAEIFSYIFLTGVAADLISIPILLSALKNKRKASIALNNQKLNLPNSCTTAFHFQNAPSICLKVRF